MTMAQDPTAMIIGAGDATDGAIDTEFIASNFPERYKLKAQDGSHNPGHIAETCAMRHAMWQHPVNMGDPAVLAATLSAAGFDVPEFMALVEDPAVKDALKTNTEAAVARGVFGAPSFFVGSDMFFGQDRLDWVEEAALRG
ncbi:MAG TPA: DsbA family protein [Polymorphobacter sp.]|nr:DsbA family protein [Polymorphobacter sp.]